MDSEKNYAVGNLVYTKRTLFALFFWLLWFDFCFQLMEMVINPILQFRLKNDLKADSVLYLMIMTTLPSIINFTVNPIVSIKSDRHRSPRGRRIPFLLYTAPVVCISLALMGFGNDIATWIHNVFLPGRSLEELTIWTLGVLFLIFTVFNMMLQTVFYYLFNDVVPEAYFIKFSAWMRVIYTLAAMVYGWFIFGYSNRSGPLHINLGFFVYDNANFWYPKLILVGVALLYGVATTAALLKVKEPEYPSPPPLSKGENFLQKTGSTVRTIVRECFSHRFYRIYFIVLMVEWMSLQMGNFQNPARADVGIDLKLLGKINAGAGFIGLILALLTAKFGSKYRPLPLVVFALSLQVATSTIAWLFLVPGRNPMFYMIVDITRSLINLPITTIMAVATSALPMTILPRDRYGQFNSAQSMLRMIIPGFCGSILAGWLMRVLERHYGNYAWRFSFVWSSLFLGLSLVGYIILYREWKRLGGKDSFTPPAVDGAYN